MISDTPGREAEGVKKRQIFADVLFGCHLLVIQIVSMSRKLRARGVCGLCAPHSLLDRLSRCVNKKSQEEPGKRGLSLEQHCRFLPFVFVMTRG